MKGMYHFKIGIELLDKVKDQAEKEGRSVSSLIREAIELYLTKKPLIDELFLEFLIEKNKNK